MLKACVTTSVKPRRAMAFVVLHTTYAVELEREKTSLPIATHHFPGQCTDPSDDANAEIDKLRQQRFESKAALQKYCGLDEDPGVLGWLQWGLLRF